MAHIVAEDPNGPRGDEPLPLAARNSYTNLLLLCNVHHKQVDDQVGAFNVAKLHEIKKTHEEWVCTSLASFDPRKQRDEEVWAEYIDEWVKKAHVDKWLDHTHSLLQAVPSISKEFLSDLQGLQAWLLSRIWPNTHAELRGALTNFRLVLNDFINVFRKHEVDDGRAYLRTDKFYKLREYNPQRYAELAVEFDFHVDLVEDLTYELTRAANYVCDCVREVLDSSFRREKGVLLVLRGMDMSLRETMIRVEYSAEERISEFPYPGLEGFMSGRGSRDYCIGSGVRKEYLPLRFE